MGATLPVALHNLCIFALTVMFNLKPIGFVGVGAFLIVNTPSLKLLAGVTPLVNAFATAVLLGAGLFRVLAYRTIQRNKEAWTLFFGIWLFVLLGALPEHLLLRDIDSGHSTNTIRMVYTLVCIGMIAACGAKRDVRSFVQCQMVWGAVLAAAYLAGLVNYTFAQSVHYKTLSLPISLCILTVIGALSEGDRSWKTKIGFGGVLLLNLIALTGLFSRSPFVFIAVIVAGFAILKRNRLGGLVKGAAKVFGYAGAGVLGLFAAFTLMDVQLNIPAINRLYTLKNQGDVRTEIWIETIHIIQDYPFGMGWGAYRDITGVPYPHNIILESGVVAGVFGAALMLGLFFLFFLWVFWKYKRIAPADRVQFVQVSYIAFYLSATFLVSYSLAYSYMMFVPIAMTTAFFRVFPSTPHVLASDTMG